MTCNEDGTIFHNLVPCGMEYGEDYGCVDNVCASLNETANDNLSIRVDLDGDGTIDQSGVFYPELVVTDAHYINNSAPIFIHSRPDESFLRFSRVWRIDNSTNGTGYEVEFGHSEPYGFEVNETVATNASGEGTFYRHGTAHVFKVYQADGPFFRIRIDLHGNGQYTDYSSYYNGDFVWSEALGVEPGEDFLITYNYDYNVRLGGQLVRYLGYDGADNEVMFYDLVTHTGETVSLSGNSGTFYKQGHAFDFELVE